MAEKKNSKVDEPVNNYGIAAALTEAMEAAVFADANASYKAYRLIEQYAYDDDYTIQGELEDGSMTGPMKVQSSELAMATFTIKDGEGKYREVSIPKITMIPLPLLHVKQATFEMSMKVSLAATQSATMKGETGDKIDPSLIKKTKLIKKLDKELTDETLRKSQLLTKTLAKEAALHIRKEDLASVKEKIKKMAGEMASVVNDTTNQQMIVGAQSEESNTTNIDLKVTMLMEQAELPEGIKLLLQAAANGLTTAAITPSRPKPNDTFARPNPEGTPTRPSTNQDDRPAGSRPRQTSDDDVIPVENGAEIKTPEVIIIEEDPGIYVPSDTIIDSPSPSATKSSSSDNSTSSKRSPTPVTEEKAASDSGTQTASTNESGSTSSTSRSSSGTPKRTPTSTNTRPSPNTGNSSSTPTTSTNESGSTSSTPRRSSSGTPKRTPTSTNTRSSSNNTSNSSDNSSDTSTRNRRGGTRRR